MLFCVDVMLLGNKIKEVFILTVYSSSYSSDEIMSHMLLSMHLIAE